MTLPYGRRAARYPFSPGAVQRATHSSSRFMISRPAVHPPAPRRDGISSADRVIIWACSAAALLFVAYSIYVDIDATGTRVTTYLPYILLFVALLIALGFEFVNGFHDTANAVATVIYTHSLPADSPWSGRVCAT